MATSRSTPSERPKGLLREQDNKGEPGLRQALRAIVHRIAAQLPDLQQPVKMYLAGGMAVNLYTGARATRDVDASFSARLVLPPASELVVPYTGPDGRILSLYLDTNYNTTFAVMHEDHEDDSWLVADPALGEDRRKIELRLLAPVDLAVSKLARFADNDREDIAALAREHLIAPEALEQRAREALQYYVGRLQGVEANLADALRIVREAQHATPPAPRA